MANDRPRLRKLVTDAQARDHTRDRIGSMMERVTKREPRHQSTSNPSPREWRRSKPRANHDSTTENSTFRKSPSGDALRLFLRAVNDHPNDTVTERGKRLGWSTYKANKTKHSAIAKGLAIELKINAGRSAKGRVVLVQLTASGYETIGVPAPDTPGYRMSPEHWWWQNAIARYFSELSDTRAVVEHDLQGKRVDVCVINGSHKHAYEVELTEANAVRNAKADLECGADHVTIACRSNQVRRSVSKDIARHIGEGDLKRVTVTTLAELPVVDALFGSTRTIRRSRQDKAVTKAKNTNDLLSNLEGNEHG